MLSALFSRSSVFIMISMLICMLVFAVKRLYEENVSLQQQAEMLHAKIDESARTIEAQSALLIKNAKVAKESCAYIQKINHAVTPMQRDAVKKELINKINCNITNFNNDAVC